MNQREATVSTILAVLDARGVEYTLNGEITVSEVLTADDKANVRLILFEMFRSGKATFKDAATKAKFEVDSELKKYVGGLLNNWMRKAREFNKGKIYVPLQPGSRQHSGDEELKALKLLSARPEIAADADAMKGIAEAIVKRKAELEALKPKAKINADVIPEHLRHLVPTD